MWKSKYMIFTAGKVVLVIFQNIIYFAFSPIFEHFYIR